MAVDADAAAELEDHASASTVEGADQAHCGEAKDDQRGAAGDSARRNRRVAVVWCLVVVTVLGCLTGWLGYKAREIHREQSQRALFVQVARQAAINLTTIDHTRVEADVQRILDSSTGTFHDDFQHRMQPFIDVVKQAQSKSQGSITEAALESQDGNEVKVLVAVTVNTSTRGVAEPVPRAWRMRIDVQKVDAGIKVANVEFVP